MRARPSTSKTAKSGRGVEHVPTDDSRLRVAELAAFGHSKREIALLIGVAEITLNKHYSVELEAGLARANEMVARCLFNEATNGRGRERVRAQEFWLKNRAGWKDQKNVTLAGDPDGAPIKASVQVEFVKPPSIERE